MRTYERAYTSAQTECVRFKHYIHPYTVKVSNDTLGTEQTHTHTNTHAHMHARTHTKTQAHNH